MNVQVRYYTRSGNTERLARAVAEAIGVTAETVEQRLTERVDVLFLCSSYYAFDVAPEVKAFLRENRDMIGEIVCVGTSAMMRSMKKPMRRAVKAYGIPVSEREFHCRGQFKKAHPGRPNAEDLGEAADFVRSVLNEKSDSAGGTDV